MHHKTFCTTIHNDVTHNSYFTQKPLYSLRKSLILQDNKTCLFLSLNTANLIHKKMKRKRKILPRINKQPHADIAL